MARRRYGMVLSVSCKICTGNRPHFGQRAESFAGSTTFGVRRQQLARRSLDCKLELRWVSRKPSNEETPDTMTAVFEAPQVRVQITHKTAWVEARETTGWVLRAQYTIPVSAELIMHSEPLSTLKAAMLDFEAARPGDTSLRTALSGVQTRKFVETAVKVQTPERFVRRAPARRSQYGWRAPLRPPLKPALSGA